VHRFYGVNGDNGEANAQAVVARISHYLDEMGVGHQLLELALETPSETVATVPFDKAHAWGLDTFPAPKDPDGVTFRPVPGGAPPAEVPPDPLTHWKSLQNPTPESQAPGGTPAEAAPQPTTPDAAPHTVPATQPEAVQSASVPATHVLRPDAPAFSGASDWVWWLRHGAPDWLRGQFSSGAPEWAWYFPAFLLYWAYRLLASAFRPSLRTVDPAARAMEEKRQ
jgi:hypothetical protein